MKGNRHLLVLETSQTTRWILFLYCIVVVVMQGDRLVIGVGRGVMDLPHLRVISESEDS